MFSCFISMESNCSLLLQIFFCLALLLGQAKPDPHPLQDYCVADNQSPLSINGVPCIDPNKAKPSHFTTSVLSKPTSANTSQFGFNVRMINTVDLPGLNTLGLTMSRIDIVPKGSVPPHSHPRASEVTICLKGQLQVGFVDTSNRLYQQTLQPGDSFVFPKGLLHFLYNLNSRVPVLMVSGFSSQKPGTQFASIATFKSIPDIPDEVLKNAFKITNQDVIRIRRSLGGWLYFLFGIKGLLTIIYSWNVCLLVLVALITSFFPCKIDYSTIILWSFHFFCLNHIEKLWIRNPIFK